MPFLDRFTVYPKTTGNRDERYVRFARFEQRSLLTCNLSLVEASTGQKAIPTLPPATRVSMALHWTSQRGQARTSDFGSIMSDMYLAPGGTLGPSNRQVLACFRPSTRAVLTRGKASDFAKRRILPLLATKPLPLIDSLERVTEQASWPRRVRPVSTSRCVGRVVTRSHGCDGPLRRTLSLEMHPVDTAEARRLGRLLVEARSQ